MARFTIDAVVARSGVAKTTMHHHMIVLRSAGIVTSRRDGNTVFYRLADPRHRFVPAGRPHHQGDAQRGQALSFAARYIGGLKTSRSHMGDKEAKPPVTLVDAKTQRDGVAESITFVLDRLAAYLVVDEIPRDLANLTGTQLHDHGGSLGAYTVVSGELSEARWDPVTAQLTEQVVAGIERALAHPAELVAERSRAVREVVGEVDGPQDAGGTLGHRPTTGTAHATGEAGTATSAQAGAGNLGDHALRLRWGTDRRVAVL